MRVIKVVYVVAIAVLLVLLVMAGLEAFYPPPPYPEYPGPLGPPPPYDSPQYEEWERQWTEIQEEYRQEAAAHHRNVFLIVLPLGLVFTVGGTFIRRRLDIFGAGLILGGLGTMIYATVLSDLDNRLIFVGIAVALAALAFVGYEVFLSSRRR